MMRGVTIIWVVLLLAVLLVVGNGCSSTLGVRPEEPPLLLGSSDPCADYLSYAHYVQQLQAAYYTRAAGNRGATYAGGIASEVTGTGAAVLALESTPAVGTVTAFSLFHMLLSSIMGTVDNPQLASLYVVAANSLGLAVVDSYTHALDTSDPQACAHASLALRIETTKARNNLELARTDAAAAGLQHALAQAAHYQEMTAQGPVAATPQGATGELATLNRLDALVHTLESHSLP